jgi:hypothetical protein
MIALLFVKLYYSIAIRIAMILPERAGKAAKEPKKKAHNPVYIETPPEKKSKGTARPTYARLISAFLSIAFVFTFLPAISITVAAAATIDAPFDVNGAVDGNGVLDETNYNKLAYLSASDGFNSNSFVEYRTIPRGDLYVEKETVTLNARDIGAGGGKLLIYFTKNLIKPADRDPSKYYLPIAQTVLSIYKNTESEANLLRKIPINTDPVTGVANDPIIELVGAELEANTIIYKLTNTYNYPVYTITKHQDAVKTNPTDGSEPEIITPEVEFAIDENFQQYVVTENIENGSGSFSKSTFTKPQQDVSMVTASINYDDPDYPEGKVTVQWNVTPDASGYILHKINRDTGAEEGNPITIKGNASIKYPPDSSPDVVYTVRDKSTVYNYEVVPYRGITASADAEDSNKNPQTDTAFFLYGTNENETYGTVVSLMEVPSAPPSVTTASPIEPKGYSVTWNKLPKITNAAEVAENPEASSPPAGYNIYRLPLNDIINTAGSGLTANSTHAQIMEFLGSDAFLDNNMALMKSRADAVFTVGNTIGTYDDINATAGAQYYYAITAFRTPITASYESKPLFLPTSTTPRPGLPANFEAEPNENRIYLKWDAVEIDDGDPLVDSYADSYIIDVTQLNASGNPTGVTGSREVTVNSPSDLRATFTNGLMTTPISINYFFTNGSNRVNITNGTRYLLTVRAVEEGVRGSTTAEVDVLVGGSPAEVSTDGISVTPSENTITLQWAAVTGADYYTITYGERDTSGMVATWSEPVRVNTNKFVHGNLANGKLFGYKIVACKEVATGAIESNSLVTETLRSDETPAVYGVAGSNIPAPVNPGFTQSGNKVNLTWTKGPASADAPAIIGYFVNIAGDDGTSQSVQITGERYTHTINKQGVYYSYSVQAYALVGGIATRSSELVFFDKGYVAVPEPEPDPTPPGGGDDTNPDGSPKLLKPRDFYVTAGASQATLTWGAVTGAQGYIVYATGPTGTFQFDITKAGFTHSNLRGGDSWTYRVVAYTIRSGDLYNYSPSTDARTVTIGGDGTGAGASSPLPAPLDFKVVTTDGKADLTWKAVTDAYSYTVTATGAKTTHHFDVSGTKFTHDRLLNGEEWSYTVTANRLASGGATTAGRATEAISVVIGQTLYQPQDLLATNSSRQIDLTWTEVSGAEGYIVYLYNNALLQFEPLTVTSEPLFSHTGLINGTRYSYMVAAYKYINNKQILSPYSMTVFGVPTTGSPTDLDRLIAVKGALPYGMDHSELVEAYANHGAFDEDVDVYVSSDDDARKAVRNELSGYGKGLESFIIYPFDVTVYYTGTRIEATPNSGFGVTFTMPLPDELVRYRDYINVVHINDMGQMEILKSSLNEINGNWCISYVATGFSPYAFVIYKDQIIDASSETFAELASSGSSGSSFNLGSMLTVTAMFTSATPTIKKSSRKRVYRIKKIR